jgi:hypothetical protein
MMIQYLRTPSESFLTMRTAIKSYCVILMSAYMASVNIVGVGKIRLFISYYSEIIFSFDFFLSSAEQRISNDVRTTEQKFP